MNIFCHVPRENWIVDRMGKEYLEYSSHNISLANIDEDTDVVWLLASWCWNQIPMEILARKKVVCTIHHEVSEKFDETRKRNFLLRDKIVNHYLTYTEKTKKLIQSLSKKPVTIIPHWVNNKIWFDKNKNYCREKIGISEDKFLIGSFQRDTEGSDLKTPKLEKGPDIFVEKILDISSVIDNVHVLLSGWRRQYVINKLKDNKIDYSYIELPDQNTINDLYNSLDLYIVSSRCEGGPQAIFECAQTKTPIISTKVGQSFILNNNCLYNKADIVDSNKVNSAIDAVESNYHRIKNNRIDQFVTEYDNFFLEV
jgi:glycosyltransferase involved in cell wall biosynthesis